MDNCLRYKPMLAYPVSERPIDYSQKVFMQPKLDGVRCLIQYEQGEVVAYSRTGKPWKNIDHILFSLEPFFNLNPNVVLDGELYNHDLKDDFEKIISCVRKTKPTDEHREESKKLVQFHCYDAILYDEPVVGDADFETRHKWILMNVPKGTYVRHVETTALFNACGESCRKCATQIHEQFLGKGYEGSILRTNSNYETKRSHNLRKFKDFHDTEAEIIGWVEGKGKRKGTIGKFIAVDSDGVQFGMPVMENFEYLQTNFKQMQGWVGKTATFTYFERTKAGSYRHPLFKCIRDYE
jgi:DNA ligase-1